MAEEIAVRTSVAAQYNWDRDRAAATVETSTGVKMTIEGDESASEVAVSIKWNSAGLQDRRRTNQKLVELAQDAAEMFTADGWHIRKLSVGQFSKEIRATIRVDRARSSIDATARTIDRVSNHLHFA